MAAGENEGRGATTDARQKTGDQIIEEMKTPRARVAELEAGHPMTDRAVRDRMEETWRLIAAATAPVLGRSFFRALVRQMAALLQARIAFIAQLHETIPGRVRLLALWVGSDFGDNFEYDVKGTPCGHVFAHGLTFFPENVRKLFPEDAWLRENDIESYLAIPLLDSADNPIGHLGVVDRNAMRDDLPRESMLRVCAARVGAEIERIRTEDELRASQARYQDLYDNAPDMFVSVDAATGTIIQCNQTLAEATGYTKEEIIGRHISEMYHPDSEQDRKRVFQAFVRRGEVRGAELELRRKDGSRIGVSLNLTAVRDEQGEVRYSRSVWRDITERKVAEKQLRDAKATAEAHVHELASQKCALDESSIVAVTDPAGKITYVNDKFCQISQYARQELIGQDHRIINSGFHPSSFFAELWNTIVAGEVWHGELCNRAKDGSLYWVNTTIVPIKDTAGKTTQFVAIRTDITERKRSEEKLRHSEERYRRLVANLHDALIVDDKQGRLTYANERFFELFGFSADDLTSIQLEDYVAPVFHKRLRDFHARRILGEEAPRQFEYEGRTKDGSSLWLEACVTTVTRDGDVIGTQTLIRDVTLRKRAEQELRRSEAELVHVTRLGAVSELATGIAHELNQPLATIVNYAESVRLQLARDPGSTSEEAGVSLQKIAEQAKRAGDIIHRLRNLLRHKEPQRSIVDLNECATIIEELIKSEARLKGVSVSTRLSDDNPVISGDGIQIQQVLLNLVQNGMDAIAERPADGHTLTISTELVDNDRVRCSVCDSGVGLSDDNFDELFKPFHTTKSEGLGLGLSVSRWIIEAHGGKISATHRSGGGAVFSFVLPVVRGDDCGRD